MVSDSWSTSVGFTGRIKLVSMAYFLNREKDYPLSLNKDGTDGMQASHQSQVSRVCRSQFPKTRSPSMNNRNFQSTRMFLVLFLALEKEAVPMKTSHDEKLMR